MSYKHHDRSRSNHRLKIISLKIQEKQCLKCKLCQLLLADFQNSFTGILTKKFAVQRDKIFRHTDPLP